MPTFNFECLDCQNEFEEFVWPSEVVKCPKCNKTNVEKKFTSCNVNSTPERKKELLGNDLWRDSQKEKHWANWAGAE